MQWSSAVWHALHADWHCLSATGPPEPDFWWLNCFGWPWSGKQLSSRLGPHCQFQKMCPAPYHEANLSLEAANRSAHFRPAALLAFFWWPLGTGWTCHDKTRRFPTKEGQHLGKIPAEFTRTFHVQRINGHASTLRISVGWNSSCYNCNNCEYRLSVVFVLCACGAEPYGMEDSFDTDM